jgi:hypothetical protein
MDVAAARNVQLTMMPDFATTAAFISLPNVQDEPLGPKARVGSGGWLGSFALRFIEEMLPRRK